MTTTTSPRWPRTLYDADVLVLDDIGFEMPGEWAKNVLYNLIEGRMSTGVGILIATSNKDVAKLGTDLRAPQISSRITQHCVQVSFAHLPDRRAKQTPQLPGVTT